MIVIAADQLRLIVAAAEAAYPDESCGLLVGIDDRTGPEPALVVRTVHESPNVAADPARRFEVDPALRFRLDREYTPPGPRLIGLYHSHPDGPAAPSAHDLESAREPDLAWLVTAVEGGRAVATTAHVVVEDASGRRFAPVALRVAT
jgi:proteasome lid subunit RPN8/RPN11